MSNSEEEEIARDYICFEKPDVTVIVVDATCLERNLNLVYQTMEITDNIIVCVNLLDEAKSKGINIDLDKLSSLLGCPVVGTIAKKKKTLNNLISTIYNVCEKKISILPSKPKYNKLIEDINWKNHKIEYVSSYVNPFKKASQSKGYTRYGNYHWGHPGNKLCNELKQSVTPQEIEDTFYDYGIRLKPYKNKRYDLHGHLAYDDFATKHERNWKKFRKHQWK